MALITVSRKLEVIKVLTTLRALKSVMLTIFHQIGSYRTSHQRKNSYSLKMLNVEVELVSRKDNSNDMIETAVLKRLQQIAKMHFTAYIFFKKQNLPLFGLYPIIAEEYRWLSFFPPMFRNLEKVIKFSQLTFLLICYNVFFSVER